MSDKREMPVSVFELREVAKGNIGYGDTKYHMHLLALAADEIERLQGLWQIEQREVEREKLRDRLCGITSFHLGEPDSATEGE